MLFAGFQFKPTAAMLWGTGCGNLTESGTAAVYSARLCRSSDSPQSSAQLSFAPEGALAYSVFAYQSIDMSQTPVQLISRFIAMNGGSAEQAASKLGISVASLSRWRAGKSHPRKHLELRLQRLIEGSADLVTIAEHHADSHRLQHLEETVSGTIHALREEFHRTASISSRQEVLDLVAALFFAHVRSIDNGGKGIGSHLQAEKKTAVDSVNAFVLDAFSHLLQDREEKDFSRGRISFGRLFVPLPGSDEQFARRLLEIFERDASGFVALHEAGRDDLINEVFSRFMSISFVDEKEMGQYLTPPEIVRFMVDVGFHSLTPMARERLIALEPCSAPTVVMDPSCGVGSFLAETIRYFHSMVRRNCDSDEASRWLRQFVSDRVVGIDKSERMIRLAMINLGLFGSVASSLRLANGLARCEAEGALARSLEGRAELILTNPPFGATYNGADIAEFAMGAGRTKVDSEILFLERYVDWLVPGGVLVTVVPESILVNRGAFADLRSWLRQRCSVEAVFSLPPATFAAAGTNTKTSVLVMRKHAKQTISGPTYFGEAREIGFDVVTRSGQRRRIRNQRSDLPRLLSEYRGEQDLTLGSRSVLPANAQRWDATFHVGVTSGIEGAGGSTEPQLLQVSDVAVLVDERIDLRRGNSLEFDYIEISDVDTRSGLVGHKRVHAVDAPSRARKRIRASDVIVSTVRPERGAVATIPEHLDGAICSTGFAVLRCHGIHPLALVWLLKTEFVRRQMIRQNIGIAYPAISEASCVGLVLPISRATVRAISEAAKGLAGAQEAFESAQRAYFTKVREFDHSALKGPMSLRKIPDVIDSGEPSAIPDLA